MTTADFQISGFGNLSLPDGSIKYSRERLCNQWCEVPQYPTRKLIRAWSLINIDVCESRLNLRNINDKFTGIIISQAYSLLWSMNSPNPMTSELDPAYDVSTSSLPIRRTRLSTVADRVFFRLPLLVPGTLCRAMSCPYHLCQLSVAA